jgi:hypothetical protein
MMEARHRRIDVSDETWFEDQSRAAEAEAMATLAASGDDESYSAGVVPEDSRPPWLTNLLATHRGRFEAGEGLTCVHRQDFNVPGPRYATSLFPGFITCTDPGCVPLFAEMIKRTGLDALSCVDCGATERDAAIDEAMMRIGWTAWKLFLCGSCMEDLRTSMGGDPADLLGD